MLAETLALVGEAPESDEGLSSLPSLPSQAEAPIREFPAAMGDAAFHGPVGELVWSLEPHSEACREALLVQALVLAGSVVGRGPYYLVEGDRHGTNLYAVLVGATSKGRKGTSFGRAAAPFRELDPTWSADRIQTGASSGEGLIHAVRDAQEAGEADQAEARRRRLPDPGVQDKRLLLYEPEWAGVLRVLARDGNTLSAIIRQAWDGGTLRTLTKHSPTRATGAHVSIIGHITAHELRRYLDRTEAGSGFGNRHLFVCVKRARLLPFGSAPEAHELNGVRRRIGEALDSARALGEFRVVMAEDARELWASVYEELSDGMPGMLGAVTSRAEAQVVRLALVYALLDSSHEIQGPHLEAALAVWDYALRSARFVFGDALGDPLADELLRLLRQAGADGLSREAIRDLLGRHGRGSDITRALALLAEQGKVRSERQETGGRPAEVWYALAAATKATKATEVGLHGGSAGLPSHRSLSSQSGDWGGTR